MRALRVSKILPWISHFVYFHKWIYISDICARARIHFQIDSTDYTRITRSTWFAANPQLLRLIQSAKYAMKICQRKRIPEHIQIIRGVQAWDRARPAAAQVETSIYFLYFFQLSFNKYISMMNSVRRRKSGCRENFHGTYFLLLSFFNKFDYAALCDYWRVKK